MKPVEPDILLSQQLFGFQKLFPADPSLISTILVVESETKLKNVAGCTYILLQVSIFSAF